MIARAGGGREGAGHDLLPNPAGRLDLRLREIARDLHHRAAGSRPAFFEPRDWLRRSLEQSLDDEGLRTALFRFVDVLPSLRSAKEVGDHLEEYFARADHALGGLTLLAGTLHAGWLVAPVVRHNVVGLARRFIAEESGPALFAVLETLRSEGAAFTLDLVGEATVSTGEALAMLGRYEALLGEVAARAGDWTEVAAIDEGPRGPIPRVNLSVKLSSLYARFDPLDPETERVTGDRLRRILRQAARLGAAITVDMENTELKDATLSIFRAVLEEDEFRAAPAAAIAIQSYLPETERDLPALLDWARRRGRRIGVRLIKGAYWDSEIAWAGLAGRPPRVFTDKGATDAAYERLTRLLLENEDIADAAFGSHNLRSLAHALAVAEELGLPRGSCEIQMLYGMAEPLRRALVERGERVRVYLPVGELVPGMAYLIRRLLENTSNVSFLRQSYADARDLEALLAPPHVEDGRPPGAAKDGDEFRNEPLTDFSVEKTRERFGAALDSARAAFPEPRDDGAGDLVSRNPAEPEEIVGRVTRATDTAVDEAVAAAASAAKGWGRIPVADRAAILFRAAAEMREQRFDLAAGILFEVGKGWRDADAEVAEAIDLLEYYGREMLAIGSGRPTQRLPGESNELRYEPLGVVAVIAPWNFPLAIAAGMTAAALVAGNTVCLKPAEQSPVVGARLHEILRRAGTPPDACRLLQGEGAVGARLVAHPLVRAVAFTGSRAVGLGILRQAADLPPDAAQVKRVICEMGGKNPLIVDGDADRDEAILAILESAFGYQGQKCSAASRLIVVGENYEPFLRRLAAAARTLRIGPPEDPRNAIGPLIDDEASRRVATAIMEAGRVGRRWTDDEGVGGPFIAPALFDQLDVTHRIAREEIFGPLLCAFPARSFEEAIEIANASPYGLTGGVFSRSPAHLELARRELQVGNLYINRAITGAVVARQPFGGLKLSGVGWKAGGPDYLKQFLQSRTIAENTLRHGFAPDR